MNLAFVAIASAALAQLAPDVGYVYPPVVPVAAVSEVHFGGYDFTPDLEVLSLDSRITIELTGPAGEFLVPPPPYWFGQRAFSGALPIPREVPARITVTKATSPGLARWQVANANGSSRCAAFLIDAGNIVVENRRGDAPQTLESLPVTVAARLGRIAEVDHYTFVAAADGVVTAELIARRIGSPFNGLIEIRDGDGLLLADVVDTEGRDCELTFATEMGKTYTVKVFDIDFRGNRAFVYALRLTPGPRVVLTRPTSGRRGQSRDVVFIGYGLQSGTARLEQVTRTVDFPHHDGPVFPYSLETSSGTTSVALRLAGIDELVDPELSELSGPVAVNGTLETVGEDNLYTVDVNKGEIWSVAIEARVLGSPLDSHLRVLAPDGSELAKGDDSGGSVDCVLEFTAAVDGRHTIVVGDLSTRVGTPEAVYRLIVKLSRPDFAVSIPQRVNFVAGGKASIEVNLSRSGGYAGEVAVAVLGLPAGVTAPADLRIPADKQKLGIELTTTADCATTAAYVRVVGVGRIGNDSVARVALAGAEGNLCPRDPARQRVPYLLLTRTMKAPLSIDVVGRERQRELPRGSTYPAVISIKRDEGYDGEISLMMFSKQSRHRQGMSGPIVKVPAGAERAIYPVFLPEWLQTDRTSRMIIAAMATVVDAQGKDHHIMVKTTSRLTMILEGALLKVNAADREIDAQPGESFEVAIDVRRRPKFTADVTLELTAPDDLAATFKAEPVVVPRGVSRAVLRVQTTADPRLFPEQRLTIRGTALQDGQWPAISETVVTVVFAESAP